MSTTVKPEITDQQRADLIELLSGLGVPNVQWLLTSTLGDQALKDIGKLSDDQFVERGLDLLIERDRLPHVVALLHQATRKDNRLLAEIDYVLNGGTLADRANLQHLVNELEPFIYSNAFDRVKLAMCAVAVKNGEGKLGIEGTGFLIGPDLVMTNAHVIDHYIERNPNQSYKIESNKFKLKETGDQLVCLFDYMSPPKPTFPLKNYAGVAVNAVKEDWLLYARPPLPKDGKEECDLSTMVEYDYAVIRLSRRVGELPARQGGGVVRGWMELPESPDLLFNKDSRVTVFQHPTARQQAHDVGTFAGWDKSRTRLRYQVSTAHGSSGGAAVDKDGGLVALHNAEVKMGLVVNAQHEPIKANQGVRIDKIHQDLMACCAEAIVKEALPADDPLDFWNLSGDVTDPRPILGRRSFREKITAMMAPEGARIMTVMGTPQSGVQYSARLLRRTVGSHIAVAEYKTDSTENHKFLPADFILAIASDLKLAGVAQNPLPADLKTETEARGLLRNLYQWFTERVEESHKRAPGRFPAWVVINTVHPTGGRLQWAQSQTECIAALVGSDIEGQQRIEIPHLRWLFLGAEPDGLKVPSKHRERDDLTNDDAEEEYAQCLALAWRALDLPAEQFSKDATYAELLLAARPKNPPRQVLAQWIHNMVLNKLGLFLG